MTETEHEPKVNETPKKKLQTQQTQQITTKTFKCASFDKSFDLKYALWCHREKNTAEEYKIEGRIFKESSKTEKESTKPDAEEAIEDCDPIYDKKKKIYYSMTTEKRGTQRTRSTTKTSYKKKVTM